MIIDFRTVGPFAENSYILGCAETGAGAFIDPGDEAELLAELMEQHRLTPKYILNTHAHIDHVGAVADLQDRYQIPFYLHPADNPWVEGLPMQARMFGLPELRVPRVDFPLADKQTFELGKLRIEVRHTPGHSEGGVTFVVTEPGVELPVAIVGDALFSGSIGRTDLPGGDFKTLLRSIRERIFSLPDDTQCFSGHGPVTTVGHEKRTNPFLT